MSAEQLAALATLITAVTGFLAVVLVQARKAYVEDREQRRKEHAEELAKISADAGYAREQLENNHGSSTKDAIDRTEATTTEVAERMKHNSEQIAAVGKTVAELAETVRAGFTRMDHQFGEQARRSSAIDDRISGIERDATIEHQRLWDGQKRRDQ